MNTLVHHCVFRIFVYSCCGLSILLRWFFCGRLCYPVFYQVFGIQHKFHGRSAHWIPLMPAATTITTTTTISLTPGRSVFFWRYVNNSEWGAPPFRGVSFLIFFMLYCFTPTQISRPIPWRHYILEAQTTAFFTASVSNLRRPSLNNGRSG